MFFELHKKKGWVKQKPYVVYERRLENYELGPFELRKLEEANRSLSSFDQKVNFIYDPKLDNLEPGPTVLKKLEEANFHLSKMKSFPK